MGAWGVVVLLSMLVRVLPPLGRFIVSSTRFFFRSFCRYCIAPLITPKGHLRYGDYQGSEGYDELLRGGFEVQSAWPADALEALKSKG